MDAVPSVITHVTPGSIADRVGLKEGDRINTIAGERIIDQIDYQALTAQTHFDMDITHADGQSETLHVNKKDWQPLGVILDQSIISKPRECANHCIFCFIDQMPPHMRNTLYVKDDDWRLSLMMGNFVTMTNISDKEFDRILRRKVSPLYISVHTTNPELRERMMHNRNAGQIMDRLRTLKAHGLRFNCQVVLCPGWNDGDELVRTLNDLETLRPAISSVALVPVGLTKYREGLAKVEPYNRETAAALIDQILPIQEAYVKAFGSRFVFPSDEFYCLSGRPLPKDEDYEGYPQIENGVGMLRLFETDIRYAVEDYPCTVPSPKRRIIATGTSVASFLREMIDRYAPKGTQIEVRPILNKFFGESVTVTGLITGGDLIDQLQDADCDEIMICRNMIRNEGDLFLDNLSVDEVRSRLPAPLRIVENTGEAFWRAVCGMED